MVAFHDLMTAFNEKRGTWLDRVASRKVPSHRPKIIGPAHGSRFSRPLSYRRGAGAQNRKTTTKAVNAKWVFVLAFLGNCGSKWSKFWLDHRQPNDGPNFDSLGQKRFFSRRAQRFEKNLGNIQKIMRDSFYRRMSLSFLLMSGPTKKGKCVESLAVINAFKSN